MANKDSVVSQRIQDSFVYLAITDTKFLQIARQSVKAKYFSSQITEDIINLCYTYFDQFKQAPDKQFHDELVRFLTGKEENKKKLYVDYLTRLQEIDSPNQAYVISRINSFICAREFEEAAIKFAELTKAGHFGSAKQLMQEALRSGIQREEVGIKYFEVKTPTYYESEQNSVEYLTPIGIESLDKRLVRGLRRTDFVCILGGYKAGKSWCCTHIGKEALIRGLKVVHISHENSAEETEMRYDMSIGGLRSFGDDEYVCLEDIDDKGNSLKKEMVQIGSVFDPKLVKEIRRKAAKFGGKLIIRKYPMGRCTIEEIKRYLDYLETYEGFIPDMVINDYVEKMGGISAGPQRRDDINHIYMQSKGIADEKKLLMITVSQTRREDLEKRLLNMKSFAEDIRKLGDVDLAIGISRTRDQVDRNRMQALILANRHGPMGFGCQIANNFKIGQFCVADWELKLTEEQQDEE